MYGRMTSAMERILYTRPLHPVIIRTHYNRLSDIAEAVKSYMLPMYEVRRRLIGGEFLVTMFEHRIIKRWSMVSGILPTDFIEDLAQDPNVVRIYPDTMKTILSLPVVPAEGQFTIMKKNKPFSFTSTFWTKKLMGCDVANEKGYTGAGVKVAVLDTGASRVHEQLRGNVNFSTEIQIQHRDENGHGTWCTACIGGKPELDDVLTRMSKKKVICSGMAPNSDLYAIKVLGYGIGSGSDSTIIKGIEDAINLGAQVISMSLGGKIDAKSQEEDAFYEPMLDAVNHGIIPVIAAGNEGPNPNTIGTPGWLESVLTVGAYDPLTGEIAKFSSRGPTPDGRTKPDVLAPGVNIDSAIVGLLDKAGDGVENRYSPISGTSMATPHVAGLMACLKQAVPDATVADVKKMMMEFSGGYKDDNGGWGPITWKMIEEYFGIE